MCELSARIIPGDAKCKQYRQAVSQSCRTCNHGQEFMPVLQLSADEMKNQFKGRGAASHRSGLVVSPAADLVVQYFDSINSQLDAKTPWSTICSLLKQATGQSFDMKSLRKYFDVETVKRGLPVRLAIHGRARGRGKKA